MTTIPVVDVSCAIFDAAGAPANGAVITFRLSRVATVNGTVVPSYVTVTTGSDGTATAQLCPNTLCGGSYGVRITAAGIDSRGVAVVPNADCVLDGIFQPVPYPADTLIESAIAQTTAQSDAAFASATQAAASRDAAAVSASAGAASASDANNSALAAAASAATALGAKTDAQAAQAAAAASQVSAAASAALAASYVAGTDPDQLVRAGDLGTAAWLDQAWLYASTTWDVPSCANAAQVSTTVAVPGADIGDKVFPSASIALSGLNLRGEVTAQDIVTLYLSNLTGSAVDLASATYYVAVLKRVATR